MFRNIRGSDKRAGVVAEPVSNSDWFCKSNNFESLAAEPAGHHSCDLHQLLLSHGLAKYIEVFNRHHIEMDTFIDIRDEELRDLGITTFGNNIFINDIIFLISYIIVLLKTLLLCKMKNEGWGGERKD